MIKYRPNLIPLKQSLREEAVFDSMDDMIRFVHEGWSKVVSFMGARKPFGLDEIIIDAMASKNQLTGWENERKILVTRMTDSIYAEPVCIGFCGEI